MTCDSAPTIARAAMLIHLVKQFESTVERVTERERYRDAETGVLCAHYFVAHPEEAHRALPGVAVLPDVPDAPERMQLRYASGWCDVELDARYPSPTLVAGRDLVSPSEFGRRKRAGLARRLRTIR